MDIFQQNDYLNQLESYIKWLFLHLLKLDNRKKKIVNND